MNSEELSLRPLQESDTDSFFALVHSNRKHLSQWLPWIEAHSTPGHSRRHIAAGIVQQALRNGGQWGIFLGSTLIGEVSLHWIQKDHQAGSMGYWIAGPYQGKGLAAMACQKLLHLCFQEYALNRLELSCALQNARSMALAQRLGFTQEGCRRQVEFHQGVFWDHALFSLLRQEYLGPGYQSNRNSQPGSDLAVGMVYN